MATTDPKPMTGAEHVREALRLADLAERDHLDLSDDERYRMLMRAHLHANLARTAAMVDATRWIDGAEHRDVATQRAWHNVFAVKP